MKRLILALSFLFVLFAGYGCAADRGYFVYSSDQITHSRQARLVVRLGERLPIMDLTRRFTGYNVKSTAGEDRSICVIVNGADGSFSVYYDDTGIVVVAIISADKTSTDALGNRVGTPLSQAVGQSADCDVGMEITCKSSVLYNLLYIVADIDGCTLIVTPNVPTQIERCAQINGFMISKQ